MNRPTGPEPTLTPEEISRLLDVEGGLRDEARIFESNFLDCTDEKSRVFLLQLAAGARADARALRKLLTAVDVRCGKADPLRKYEVGIPCTPGLDGKIDFLANLQ